MPRQRHVNRQIYVLTVGYCRDMIHVREWIWRVAFNFDYGRHHITCYPRLMYMVPNAILVIKAEEICTGLFDLVTPNEWWAVANQSMQQGFNTMDRDLFLGHDVQAMYNSEATSAKSSQPRLGGSVWRLIHAD
jgi:hypothetical protein